MSKKIVFLSEKIVFLSEKGPWVRGYGETP